MKFKIGDKVKVDWDKIIEYERKHNNGHNVQEYTTISIVSKNIIFTISEVYEDYHFPYTIYFPEKTITELRNLGYDDSEELSFKEEELINPYPRQLELFKNAS